MKNRRNRRKDPVENRRDQLSPQTRRSVDASEIVLWRRALNLQAERATDPSMTDIDNQADIYLFIITLRQLLRAVEFCEPHAEGDITAALHEFDQAIPGATDARDIIVHFDDYEQGIGNLQQPRGPGRSPLVPADLLQWFYRDGSTAGLNVGPFRIDVVGARVAGCAVADRALEAMWRDTAPT